MVNDYTKHTDLVAYDKLNIAMSLVKKLSKDSDDNWKEIIKIAENNNMKVTDLNRTIAIWLRNGE